MGVPSTASASRKVVVSRVSDGSLLSSNSQYIPGETLTVTCDPELNLRRYAEMKQKYKEDNLLHNLEVILEASGGATFTTGNKLWYLLNKFIISLTYFSFSSSGENRYYGISF